MGHRGFTLIELLVAVAVFAVILLAIGSVYGLATWTASDNDRQAYLQRQGS